MMQPRALIMITAVAAIITGSSLLAGCSSTASSTAATSGDSCTYSRIQAELHTKGVLTIATDRPVYSPWFENNMPSNGLGYESGVAYAVATWLGFPKSRVSWVYEPFESSYAPGPKKFDFDINEISYTAERAQVVSFSESYYDVQQALVALKGSPITAKHTPAELKTYVYGDVVGGTSLSLINAEIVPTQTPKIFGDLNALKQALLNKQIGAFVIDTPTAQYISSSEIPGSVMVGQFPSTGEHYGMLSSKGNPLVSCVNKALTALKANGTLMKLQSKYLQIYLSLPTIEP